MKKFFYKRLSELVKSRLFVMLGGVVLLFSIIGARLFMLQILDGEEYLQAAKASIMQTLSIPASRGTIYDRYGRPLATNQAAFSVKFDDSVKLSLTNRNKQLSDAVKTYLGSGNDISDTLPITNSSSNRSFTFSNEEDETKWKQSIGLSGRQLKMSADEVYDFLTEKYISDDSLNEETKRKILSLATETDDKNLLILSLIQLLDKNNETLADDLPISKTTPYTFLFDGNSSKEASWKKEVSMKDEELNYNAEQTVDYLEELFNIPSCLSENTKRELLSVRYALYLKRYRKYQPVTIALNVNSKTVSSIEEKNDIFPGVYIDTDSLRYYNCGEYFSHMLGYIGKISDTEYEELKDDGYTSDSIIGKSGVESLYEKQLNGKDGERVVEVDAAGRRISTVETKEPVSGSNVYLTIDEKLQKTAFDSLESALSEVLIRKLTSSSLKDMPISLKELFVSMVNSNNVSIKDIYNSTDGVSLQLKNMILAQNPSFDLTKDEDMESAKLTVTNAIENNTISAKQMILLLIEQGVITADDDYKAKIQNGAISPLSVIIEKLRSKDLRPAETDLDPCSGSVVVENIHTGETLTLVTYPSYDNNRFVNNFDSEYYSKLLNDPATPLVNRPLRQKKAPGSTFKMVTAIAGLETGVITPYSYITDQGTFKKAGLPYARCWTVTSGGGSHGAINVSTALEVSCNYFFYETSYRMGNTAEGTATNSIETIKKYAEAFGLGNYTGIEIGEYAPNIASPEYKEEITKRFNPDATTSQTRWTDGDTIRAAIGQSVNNYAPVHMAKYVATLANGGTRYTMHMIDRVETADGIVTEQKTPTVESTIDIKEENLKAVYQGMLAVTSGSRGTLRKVFKDFPIKVAAKSGTAQENLSRSSHTWFVCFAPYDDPQISISVMIPFGENSYSPAAVVAKDVISEYMGLNYQPSNNYMKNTLAK